jgi:hypothetical protein
MRIAGVSPTTEMWCQMPFGAKTKSPAFTSTLTPSSNSHVCAPSAMNHHSSALW